jgi:hypothetical protein
MNGHNNINTQAVVYVIEGLIAAIAENEFDSFEIRRLNLVLLIVDLILHIMLMDNQ